MTPEEYQQHLESLKGEHEELFNEMAAGQPEPDGVESAAGQIPEPEMPAPAVPDTDTEDVAAIQSNQIHEPPAMTATVESHSYPESPDQSNPIPEPPQEEAPDIEAFIQEQKSKWSAARQPSQPQPPEFDLREDSGMPDLSNLRDDVDEFASQMQSTYESVQQTFRVISDLTGAHGSSVHDILATLMRQRLP